MLERREQSNWFLLSWSTLQRSLARWYAHAWHASSCRACCCPATDTTTTTSSDSFSCLHSSSSSYWTAIHSMFFQECVPAHVCSGRFEPFDNSPNAVNQSIINYFLNHWLDSSYIHWLVDVVEMFNFRFSSWSLLQSTTSSNNTTTSSTDSTSRSSTSWLLPTSSSTATYATSFDSVPFNPWMYSSSYLRWPFRIVWW